MAWLSTVIAVIGIMIGIPLGPIVGHVLWTASADEIYAVPVAVVSTLSVVAIGVGAVVGANLVATIPAQLAARTRTGGPLRAE